MRSPTNHYRYELTDSVGVFLAEPLGESSLKRERTRNDENKLSYSDEQTGKLTFTGSDYQRLATQEDSPDRCDPILLQIYRNCGGSWETFGPLRRFVLNDATWNRDRCEVEIKFDKFEPEDCFEQKKSQEVNLFDLVPDRYTTKLYRGTVVIEKVTYSIITNISNVSEYTTAPYWAGSGTPEAGGWAPYYIYVSMYIAPFLKLSRETRWARQKLVLPDTDPAPGPEWILISTGGGFKTWVKPAAVYDTEETFGYASGSTLKTYKKEGKILGDGGAGISTIDNGMKLADCFQAFADALCVGLTVKSQFFQINPDTVTTTNYVTAATSKVRNILVYQKSDVKRPNVSGNATKLSIGWEKFIMQLVEGFNVRWRVIGSVLRIEHVSWFPQAAGLNLTGSTFDKYTAGMEKYTYKSEEIPSQEVFKFMEATPASDFEGVPIIYEGGCVSTGRDNVKTHAADFLTTDVELCLNNPSAKDSVVDDKGIVLIAVDDDFNVLSDPPILETTARLNNTLAWAQLHADYHRHYRLLHAGIMNNAATTFASVKPIKKGVPVSIPFCCGDTFNPDDIVTTELGAGVVEKASFNFKNDTLTLELIYPVT